MKTFEYRKFKVEIFFWEEGIFEIEVHPTDGSHYDERTDCLYRKTEVMTIYNSIRVARAFIDGLLYVSKDRDKYNIKDNF